ncbi:family 10 glycosylhydrolase [[Eubacterium] tenue]|nr:family 10 glycosylhydrolase [[Eubacterium] tenue]MBC8630927.1 family 10 glycosylhydrolase [[Eubacterium] tenue]
MKKAIAIIIACALLSLGISTNVYADNKDMRAAWITTVYNADWPKIQGNINTQKNEMINILDNLKDAGINTVMFQARPKADALYRSNINPWSDVLTGTQGEDPGYDPLEFVIQEAHKRGMKVHAWLNPYRVTTSGTDLNRLSEKNPARQHPEWTLINDGRIYYNPDLPQVKQHIYDTVGEIVRNYNVDGIHFDDYFYPANYPLPEGESRDGEVANSRRNHINEMIEGVKRTIKNIKPNVKFGVSPSGIWKNIDSDPSGSDTKGKESYYSDYADTLNWVNNNYIDYIVPQIYWNIGYKIADYSKLINWWSNKLDGKNVDLYIGHGIYKDVIANEIDKQIDLNIQYQTIKGSVFYSTSDILFNRQGCRDKIKKSFENDTSFIDIKGHWAENYINNFYNKGYINGYEDNTFKPENPITRAEFVKVFNKVFGLTKTSGKVFSDTVNHWAKNEIDIAVTNGVSNGMSKEIFAPDKLITREEAAKMLANYKGIADSNHDKSRQFNDYNEISDWAKDSVEGAIEYGYINGMGNGTLAPKNPMKRAEVVVMLSRIK